jgi:hypothetical protein
VILAFNFNLVANRAENAGNLIVSPRRVKSIPVQAAVEMRPGIS